MHIRQRLKSIVVGMLLILPTLAVAQSSSINTFSPYSFYGIGNLSTQGVAHIRSMGGAGVAFRDTYLNPYSTTLNNLNPASYSAIPQKAFVFNFELEGQNFYLKDINTKSSYNTFNIRDVAILFPLGKKIGFGLSVTPYSSVGYRMEQKIEDEDVIADIGDVRYKFEGEGDITLLKAGVGLEIFKNFSLGAEMLYYFGSIDRKQSVTIRSITGGGNLLPAIGYFNEEVSKIFASVGFQYNVLNRPKRMVTIGGTYKMGGKLGVEKAHRIDASDNVGSVVWFDNSVDNRFKMADEFALGVFYQTAKLSAGFDYTFANWGNKNKFETDVIKYINTNALKLGAQYTPNRFDVRSFLNRITYRAGFRYQNDYMEFHGNKIVDKAITIGLGIPVKLSSPSNINIGFEIGQRGSTKAFPAGSKVTGSMVKESYFKISIGLNLFGEDYWFRKRKFD